MTGVVQLPADNDNKDAVIELKTLNYIELIPLLTGAIQEQQIMIETQAEQLAEQYPDHVRVILRYDGTLARRIYAGADMILIPSRYEPCGLTQMIAMRYGCVPVARATGGLTDTIVDYGADKQGVGFLFYPAHAEAFAVTIARGIKAFQDKRRWRGIQLRGMKLEFSWARSAKEYLNLYRSLVK